MRKVYFVAGRDRSSLCHLAVCTSALFLIAAVVLLVETVIFPIRREDLSRLFLANNMAGIVAFISLSCFLGMWYELYSKLIYVSDIMKSYKFLTIVSAIVSALKSVVSAVLAFTFLAEGNKVGIFYGVETVAWLALTLFFFVYSGKLVSNPGFLVKDVHNHAPLNAPPKD